MRTVVVTLFLCLAISQTQAFHMPDKVCKKVEAGSIKMVSALLICVEKMATLGAVALEQKAQASALRLKAKQDALSQKAFASALGKKVHVVEKHKARQEAHNQKAHASAHAEKALLKEKLKTKQNAIAQKAQASALGKKAHVVEKLKAKQAALTKRIVHAMLSKVGCSKRRRLFHHSFKGAKAILAKASLAKKAFAKVIEVKKQAAEKLKNMACGVISKACNPACANVVNVASKLASTFGIPLACVSDSLKKSCMDLCHKICSKRRLAPRRLAKAEHKSRKNGLRRAQKICQNTKNC